MLAMSVLGRDCPSSTGMPEEDGGRRMITRARFSCRAAEGFLGAVRSGTSPDESANGGVRWTLRGRSLNHAQSMLPD